MALMDILKRLRIIDSEDIQARSGPDGTRLYLVNQPTAQAAPSVPTIADAASTRWTLEKSGNNVLCKDALAFWYSEKVYEANENSPLTWTNPGTSKTLYADVVYSGSWSLTATTTAAGTEGHQYFPIGSIDSSGNITTYQTGILWIGDRYQ